MNGRRGVPKRSSRDTDGIHQPSSRTRCDRRSDGLNQRLSATPPESRNSRQHRPALADDHHPPRRSDRASIGIANELEQAFTAAGIDVSLDVRSGIDFHRTVLYNHDFDICIGRHPAEPIPTTSTRRCTRAMPTNRAGRTHSATPTWPSTTSSRSNAAPRAMNDATLSKRARGDRGRTAVRSDLHTRGTPGRQNGSIHRLERKTTSRPVVAISVSSEPSAGVETLRATHGCKTDGKPQSALAVDYRGRGTITSCSTTRWRRTIAGTVHPWLAKSWGGTGRRSISDCETAAKFHDGTSITANDIEFVRVSQRHVPR